MSGFPRLLLILAAITEARLSITALIPLTDDEAYYRLWAAHLQFGYFDHPPMIAWWIAAAQAIAGEAHIWVRLLPVLAAAVSSLLTYDLARTLGASERTAERAAIFLNCTLLFALGSALAVPDSPTVLFWTLCLACAARAVRPGAPAGWWIAAGAAAGLASLSKYSGLFLAPGLMLWLVSTPSGRAQLRQPAVWAAAVLALALFGINVGWNASHHWVTFVKQFGRVVPAGFAPQHVAELLATQFVLLSPVIVLLAVRGGAGAAPRRPALQEPSPFMLLATSAPFAAYLLLHSTHAAVQGQWPAPLYPSIAVLAAIGVESLRPSLARYAEVGVVGAAVVVVAIGLIHVAAPWTDRFGPHDPVLMLRDWPRFTRQVDLTRRGAGAGWIGVLSYQTKSQLELGLGRTPVIQLTQRARYGPADSSWTADLSQPGLVVELARDSDPSRLARCFAQVTPIGDLRRGGPGATQAAYAMSVVSGPRTDLLRAGC